MQVRSIFLKIIYGKCSLQQALVWCTQFNPFISVIKLSSTYASQYINRGECSVSLKWQLRIFTTVRHQRMKGLQGALGGILWIWRNGGSGAEVLQNKNLQDLIEVLNSGTVQVLLVVIKRVPHRRKGGGDKVKDPNTWQRGTLWGSPKRTTQ